MERSDDDLAALKAGYEELRRETERLRDARASLTRQLGPLPISAAVVAGLVTGFAPPNSEDVIRHDWMLWVAGGLFGLLVLLSILYSNLRPYRELRRRTEAAWKRGPLPAELIDRLMDESEDRVPSRPSRTWYKAAIQLERTI